MDFSAIFYQDWAGVVRTAIVGIVAYAALVLTLRISGNRTLAKLNAFDLVVTVAMGSVLATILLSEDVALAEGITAFLVLIILQWVVAWLSVRFSGFAKLIRSEPTLLFRNGEMLRGAMRRARVTKAEMETVIRTHGRPNFAGIASIILEADGSFSIVDKEKESKREQRQRENERNSPA
ncbi:DUF421 domain-containing protein [Notoacmeibacter ruber]|uniref:DUF421 domain-containing protein n=1 Tax=Notoacmeibacter ruber TaxID=2670375 RepID=A0A3L7JC41_9HYPH|nr:YetF domain-containing protein [Notoacmeibacter ruber]RLQ88206.1 DUF421 domain-containing protein [Notoacmeibacter ruber]